MAVIDQQTFQNSLINFEKLVDTQINERLQKRRKIHFQQRNGTFGKTGYYFRNKTQKVRRSQSERHQRDFKNGCVDFESKRKIEYFHKVISSNSNAEVPGLISDIQKHLNIIPKSKLNEAFIIACKKGNKFLIQGLLSCYVRVNCRDSRGNTPLMICAKNGFSDIAKLLIEKGADVNAVNANGDTALLLSITKFGSKDLVRMLISSKSLALFSHNSSGQTCFTQALQLFDFDVLRILLTEAREKIGCEYKLCILKCQSVAETLGILNIFNYLEKEISGQNSAVLSAVSDSDFKSVKFIFDYGLVKNMCEYEYYNNDILTQALNRLKKRRDYVNGKDIEIVKLIISEVKKTDYRHCSEDILTLAVEIGNCELLDLLCQYVNEKYSELEARDIYYKGLKTLLNNYKYEFLKILLEYKPNLISFCKGKRNLIEEAVQGGATEFVELILGEEPHVDVNKSLLISIDHSQPACFNMIVEKFHLKTYLATSKESSQFLNRAAKAGNKEIIERLLSLGADVNSVYEEKTPLMNCLNAEIANILLLHGADVNLRVGRNKISALLNLFLQKKYDRYSLHSNLYYLNQEKKKTVEEKVDTLLALVQTFLSYGANIEDTDSDGKTILMLASSLEKHDKIITHLLESGADPNRCDNNGHNALYYAVSKQIVSNVEALFKFHVDVNARYEEDMTALHLSAMYMNEQLLGLLIAHSANLHSEDINGNTALMLSVNGINIKKEIIEALLDAGSIINHQNKEGKSPIIIAAEKCSTDLVLYFCERGADLTCRKFVDCKNVVEIVVEKCTSNFRFVNKELISCAQHLLKTGGTATNIDNECIFKLISLNHFYLLQRLIFSGVSPSESSQRLTTRFKSQGKTVSPFRHSLIEHKVKFAKYFSDICFLTASDCFYNPNLISRTELVENGYTDCVEYFDEFFSQPMSLQKLSLIKISTLVGPGITREDKIKKLPIPTKFKDQLMFKTDKTITAETDEEMKADSNSEIVDLFTYIRDRDLYYVSESDSDDYYSHDYYGSYYGDSSDY